MAGKKSFGEFFMRSENSTEISRLGDQLALMQSVWYRCLLKGSEFKPEIYQLADKYIELFCELIFSTKDLYERPDTTTGRFWRLLLDQSTITPKYLICNGVTRFPNSLVDQGKEI